MKRHPLKLVRLTPKARSALTAMQPAANGNAMLGRAQENEVEMRDAESSEDAVMTSVNEGDPIVAGQASQGADIEMQDLSQIFQPQLFANQPGTAPMQPTAGQPQRGCRLCALLGVTRNLPVPAAFPSPPAGYLSAVPGGTRPRPVCRLCTSLAAQATRQAVAGTTFASSLAFAAGAAASQSGPVG